MRMSSVSFGLPLILLLAVVGGQGQDCTTVFSHSCNTASTQPGSPLETSLTSIIHDLEDNTYSMGIPGYTSIDYKNEIANPNQVPAAYGQGVCVWEGAPACTACLTNLANCISSACGLTVGAWAQANYGECYMRYETYKFY